MNDTHRFFVAASDAVCEQIRAQLDAAWGHPTPDGKTVTCFLPVSALPHDSQGRPMLCVDAAFCDYQEVAALLPTLIANQTVVEVTREQYNLQCPTARLP